MVCEVEFDFTLLSSPPQIGFFLQISLPGSFATNMPGVLQPKFQQQKVVFPLFFLPLLFAILSAKLGSQDVCYFESLEGSIHIFPFVFAQ